MPLFGFFVVFVIGLVVGVALDNKAHGAVMAVADELKHLGIQAGEALRHLKQKA